MEHLDCMYIQYIQFLATSTNKWGSGGRMYLDQAHATTQFIPILFAIIGFQKQCNTWFFGQDSPKWRLFLKKTHGGEGSVLLNYMTFLKHGISMDCYYFLYERYIVYQHIPSLKLTVRTRKCMVRIQLFPFGSRPIFRG